MANYIDKYGNVRMEDGTIIASVGIKATPPDPTNLKESDFFGSVADAIPSVEKIMNDLGDLDSFTPQNLMDSKKKETMLQSLSIEATVNSTAQIVKSNQLLAESVTGLKDAVSALFTASNELALNSIHVNAILGTQYLDGQQDNIKAMDKQTKAIQEQKLTSSHTTINRIDTEPLVSATAELAKGVSSQIATNKKIVENIEKKNESLDFHKNGLSTLRDTNNNIISPREAQAKVNAEKYIEQKEMNETTIGEFMEFSGEIFNSLSDDAINEGGISLNFNPFEAMLNIYKTDIENEKRELQK